MNKLLKIVVRAFGAGLLMGSNVLLTAVTYYTALTQRRCFILNSC